MYVLDSTLALHNCTFRGNHAAGRFVGPGGGLYISGGSGELFNCTFQGNNALTGGGLAAESVFPLTLYNCWFNANSAISGGGLSCTGVVKLINCTLNGNLAEFSGGGLFIDGGPLTELTNCIFWSNAAKWDSQIGGVFGDFALSHCIVQGWEWGLDTNPELTPDGHLKHTSPAIDAGDPNFSALPSTDFDGEPRVFGGYVDIGADEYIDSDDNGLPNWWERRYFGVTTGTSPEVDTDSDGLTNEQEYERYGSNPCASPIYVDDDGPFDPLPGDPNVSDPNEDGSSAHPFDAIQEGLDAAGEGNTVCVAAGYYDGDGNKLLDYPTEPVVVYASDGPSATTIDCGSLDTLFWVDPPRPLHAVLAILEGFKITYGDPGISMYPLLGGVFKNCLLEDNSSADEPAGIDADTCALTLDNFTIGDNTSPEYYGGIFRNTSVQLQGDLNLEDERVASLSSWFSGPAQIHIAQNTNFWIRGDEIGDPPTVIRTNVAGLGNIVIEEGQQLFISNGARVDLSGGDPNIPPSDCGDPNEALNWGNIYADGTLYVQDSTIQNTNVEVRLGDLAGTNQIVRNDISMVESSAGYGGEFYVDGPSTIHCNVIRSDGDRYLDLDPDPNIPPAKRPIIGDNWIYVTIKQGVGLEQGELLELRSFDGDPTVGAGMSGAHYLPFSSGDPNEGYGGTWAFERLEVTPNAKVNLTNRPSFVFQQQDPNLPEAVYVKELKLDPNAILNTGLQRLYYQKLVDENGLDLTRDPNNPAAPMSNGSRIVDYPLLGFSLKVITFEDIAAPPHDEFTVRVRQRLRDPLDIQPGDPNYPGDPSDQPLEGSMGRITDTYDPNNNVMQMLTQAPGKQAASSIAAHGAFARAGEDRILIEFKYRFCDLPNDPNAYLLVYLSDDPEPRDATTPLIVGERDDHIYCVAQVFVPQAGRPGSIGSSEFATFFGEFDRGSLNFTRGTYVELELRGNEDACIEIDDWDPQISCEGACHDLTGEGGVSERDFLLLLAEYGRDVAGQEHPKRCLDSKMSWDQYIDIDDILAWDTVMSDPNVLNLCEPPLPPGGTGTPISSLPTDGLLIAGKPNGAGLQDDWLYHFNSDGTAPRTGTFQPACVPPYRGNGRLIQDPNGTLHQLHATQGLIRLDSAERILTPFFGDFNVDGTMRTVYVGVQETWDIWGYPDGCPHGLPILDAAFNPNDATQLYVVPVAVESAYDIYGTPYPHYRAAARLTYSGGSWSVTQLYGYDYCDDPCKDANPCFLSSCLIQDQREVEVDGVGHVYVINGSAHSPDNDWLVVYDESSGTELEACSANGC